MRNTIQQLAPNAPIKRHMSRREAIAGYTGNEVTPASEYGSGWMDC